MQNVTGPAQYEESKGGRQVVSSDNIERSDRKEQSKVQLGL